MKKHMKLTPKSIIILVVSVILGLVFLSPFYIIIVNSFKSKKELFSSTLALPHQAILDN